MICYKHYLLHPICNNKMFCKSFFFFLNNFQQIFCYKYSIPLKFLQVVTKIKVQEVQVESQETLDSLRACEREREEYRAQLEDSQSQHSQLSALLEQEQGLNEQLSDQVSNRDLGRLIGSTKLPNLKKKIL